MPGLLTNCFFAWYPRPGLGMLSFLQIFAIATSEIPNSFAILATGLDHTNWYSSSLLMTISSAISLPLLLFQSESIGILRMLCKCMNEYFEVFGGFLLQIIV